MTVLICHPKNFNLVYCFSSLSKPGNIGPFLCFDNSTVAALIFSGKVCVFLSYSVILWAIWINGSPGFLNNFLSWPYLFSKGNALTRSKWPYRNASSATCSRPCILYDRNETLYNDAQSSAYSLIMHQLISYAFGKPRVSIKLTPTWSLRKCM